MKKQYIIIGIIAIALAILAIVLWLPSNKATDNTLQQPTTSQQTTDSAPAELSETEKMYTEMTGETYDRNFLANMMAHHQGAIDMASLAANNAKHQEIKNLADRIIIDQDKEIATMQNWQKAWGYPPTSGDNMQDHSAMGMMDSMSMMNSQLRDKKGDDFDKEFLKLMIEHHESALQMARPGEKNALRQELKGLTQQIVKAQTAEIAQMKQWQKAWGYTN